MAIKIGVSQAKVAYVGASRVKHIYLGNSLVFSDTVNLTLSIGTGVASVEIKSTRVDGAVTTATYSSSTTIGFAYGSALSISATAAYGYTINSYTSSTTITEAKSLSYTATVNSFWTDVNLNYGGTQYGGSYGDRIGTFYYSTNNSNWYGPYSNEPWGSSTLFAYNSNLYLRSIGAAPGFYLSSVTYNGSNYSSSGGTYTIPIANGSYNVDVNFGATTSYSSASLGYSKATRTNSLSRTAFNVSFSLDIDVETCGAGTVIGTVPYQFRPTSAKTYTTNWKVTTGTTSSTTTAVITINTDGTITSNTASEGSGSQSGGGKWGSFSISWVTKLSISGSWSVI